MTDKIEVTIKRDKDYFIAESAVLPGLFVAHTDLARVYKQVPKVIQAIYKVQYESDVVIKEKSNNTENISPLVIEVSNAA